MLREEILNMNAVADLDKKIEEFKSSFDKVM
jgi:hypothetical protein